MANQDRVDTAELVRYVDSFTNMQARKVSQSDIAPNLVVDAETMKYYLAVDSGEVITPLMEVGAGTKASSLADSMSFMLNCFNDICRDLLSARSARDRIRNWAEVVERENKIVAENKKLMSVMERAIKLMSKESYLGNRDAREILMKAFGMI